MSKRSSWRQRTIWLALALISTLILVPASALAAPEPPPRHVVQPGETLGELADRYVTTVPAIVAANLLADPDQIPAGLVLAMPPADQPLLRIVAGPKETLSSIARAYRTTPALLRNLNEMPAQQRLIVGQDLLVPPRPGDPSPALPAGPIQSVAVRPGPAAQGETLLVTVEASQPLSLSLALDGLTTAMRPLRNHRYWALMGIHALTEPGVVRLGLRWQTADSGASGEVRWPVQVVDGGYSTYDIILPPDKGDLLDPELVQAEAERLAAIWNSPETERAWRGPFLRPVADEFVTSAPFGQRRSYNSGPVSGFHTGQDFAAPEGTPVIAPAAGTVVLAEPLIVRGNSVIIDHGYGVYSGYWHLSAIEVAEGEPVQPGDLIGLVGTTGLSTGNHLHWELRLHGLAVTPVQWLEQAFP